jgi:hypothetical protein
MNDAIRVAAWDKQIIIFRICLYFNMGGTPLAKQGKHNMGGTPLAKLGNNNMGGTPLAKQGKNQIPKHCPLPTAHSYPKLNRGSAMVLIWAYLSLKW